MSSQLVKGFFERHERAGSTLDLDVIGAEFADRFMFADPNGAGSSTSRNCLPLSRGDTTYRLANNRAMSCRSPST